MAPLKYYYYPEGAPNRAALLTIRNLNLKAEVILVDLRKKEHLTENFVKINPQRCMPLLDDDGFFLWESRAISQYLVTTRAPGSSLYPADPKKRAVVDARLFLDSTLHAVSRSFFYPIHSMGETKIPELPKQRLYQLLGYLDDMMEGKKFVAGDELTIADFSILASFSTYFHSGANVSGLKNLMAWYKRCESLPGFQENEEAAKDFGKMFKSKINVKETWEEIA
uniref:glutathione transferase n=1 Tax=Phlebotomus kandelakii TaxID=1109342 RepID=A0A6B2EAA1_9DIPT